MRNSARQLLQTEVFVENNPWKRETRADADHRGLAGVRYLESFVARVKDQII